MMCEAVCIRSGNHRRVGTHDVPEGVNPRDVKVRCRVCGGSAYLQPWATTKKEAG